MERNLEDAPPFRMHPDQDLLQHVEVPCHQRESHQDVAMVHAKPAGQIAERQRQDPAVRAVQNMAQEPAEPAHVCPPAGDVAGGNQHLRLVAPPPELFQEHRSVGQVGVHGDNVGGGGGRKAGQERAAVARLLLHDDTGSPPLSRVRCSIP